MTITPLTCSPEQVKAQVGQEGACLSEEEREITVLVHPKYTRDQVTGVKKELDALSRRYNKELGGVVVAYEKLRLVSASGWLFDTSPFIHLRVSAHFIVFCPTAGDTLTAVVRKKSPHHLGCLAHGSFNISVPRPPRESVEGWAGTLAAEGDTLTLTVLFTSLTSYLMPFIRASIHPDCAKELHETAEMAVAAEGATTSVMEGNDGINLNSRTVFDNDSGISSNEAEENGKTLKRKRSEETEEEGEKKDAEDSSRKSKKRKKKHIDGEEESRMRKKKKKLDDVAVNVGEGDGERVEVRGKKRKRKEEEDGRSEIMRKKRKKKNANDSYLEAVEIKREKDREEDISIENFSPLKKKRNIKKENMEERKKKESKKTKGNVDKGAREAVNDEIDVKRKKKKKKQLKEEEKEEGELSGNTIRKKHEKFNENGRRNESIDKGEKEIGNMAVRVKTERRQTEEETVEANGTLLPTEKKKKMRIKEERMSLDERSLDDLPIPLFMIKKEK